MEFINANIEISAVMPSQYPDTSIREVALVGRSNVGKSSLINCLCNRKSLARTSATPGKTATVNFYNIDGRYRLVDLPGYGYAKRSKAEIEKWAGMIETYLKKRENLYAVIQLVDSRHAPSKDDIMMVDWIRNSGYDPIVVATKMDKLKKSEIEPNLTRIYEDLELDDSVLIPFSSVTKEGREEILELIEMAVNKGKEDNND
ncbi:MAG: YihA family ribosome biogenesis GTP-binding protein [Clostridia bacterium]|nr:YihA family ribosome biogenesis GTP-binding protein [Clostridia bacterium]MBO5505380.1 YihA family ribosome biogenesis GTP-binding protein [Clostridia bacterium]